jgi:hypothetical protein
LYSGEGYISDAALLYTPIEREPAAISATTRTKFMPEFDISIAGEINLDLHLLWTACFDAD